MEGPASATGSCPAGPGAPVASAAGDSWKPGMQPMCPRVSLGGAAMHCGAGFPREETTHSKEGKGWAGAVLASTQPAEPPVRTVWPPHTPLTPAGLLGGEVLHAGYKSCACWNRIETLNSSLLWHTLNFVRMAQKSLRHPRPQVPGDKSISRASEKDGDQLLSEVQNDVNENIHFPESLICSPVKFGDGGREGRTRRGKQGWCRGRQVRSRSLKIQPVPSLGRPRAVGRPLA